MTRIATLAGTFIAGMLLAFALASTVEGSAGVSADGSLETQSPSTTQPELDDGSFSWESAYAVEPVAFVWVREDANGDLVETWALFRPETIEGWHFPGVNHTSVDLTVGFEGSLVHDDLQDFLQWAEDQYPASMNVDKDLDFEVHIHTVTVL